MSRMPVRQGYDAVLDFTPGPVPEAAYAIIKQTFQIGTRGCVLQPPDALEHDLRDPNLEPKMPPGSDFWIQKEATDVVVRGSAYALGGRPVRQMQVAVSVGTKSKRIEVFGERQVEWRSDGRPVLPEPEPFTEIPLTYANAYGGIDPRLEMAPPASPEELLDFDLCNYPGIYPRNLHGKGYLVDPRPLYGVPLPNLENPDDLLTADRLVVRAPQFWYQQPLPWCFEWTHPLMFPRMVYLGLTPPFPLPPSDFLPETKAGFLAPDFAERYGMQDATQDGLPAEFYQEASFGMRFDALAPGTRISVQGMHPDKPYLDFALPSPPAIRMRLDGQELDSAVALTNCIITPAESKLSLVYAALAVELPRVFIPGIHKEIPFVVEIDGDAPLAYEPPVPTFERLEKRE